MIPLTRDAMRLLHEGAMVLSKIEANGVRVNVEYLDKMTTETEARMRVLEDEIRADPAYQVWRRRFGDRTNIGSHTQLAAVVHKDLGVEVRGYTEKGNVKAGKEELDDTGLPIVDKFFVLQNLGKTVNTYFRGVRQEMVRNGNHWYVHPSYNISTISTYRSSSNSPNFQNVPKRNPDMAKLIRPCYLPHPGHHWVEVDFSQLEVRIAACYHNDPVMVRYIEDPTTDMHRDTAMEMFFLNKEQYAAEKDYFKKTVRDSAKNQFVFPQFYGSNYVNCCKAIWKRMTMQKFKGPHGDSMEEYLRDRGITARGACGQGEEPVPGTFEHHLREVERKMWHKRFKVYTQWKYDWFNAYRKVGGFAMKTGFAVNGLYGRRDATNYPIQGSAFHCLVWVLIELQKWLTKYKMRSLIVGEIHDAAELSVHPAELQDVLAKVYALMTKALLAAWDWITVPLEAECDVGPKDGHWMTCEQWTESETGVWGGKA